MQDRERRVQMSSHQEKNRQFETKLRKQSSDLEKRDDKNIHNKEVKKQVGLVD